MSPVHFLIIDLVDAGSTFKLPLRSIVNECRLFSSHRALLDGPYAVRLHAPIAIFQDFLAGLEGKPIEITNENVGSLSSLCTEFGPTALMVNLTEFRAASAFRGASPKEDCDARVRIGGLEGALSASLERISQLEAEVSGPPPAPRARFDSAIVLSVPSIFKQFLGKHFSLLCRGRRDGSSAVIRTDSRISWDRNLGFLRGGYQRSSRS
jgi:hypothetical protein